MLDFVMNVYLSISTLGNFAEIILSACRNSTKKYLLRYSSPQCHAHAIQQLQE